MTWNLFIDDERWPLDATWAEWYGKRNEWMVARTWIEVCELIDTYGMPDFISFDHDLGPEEIYLTGYKIAQEIVNKDISGEWAIPENFSFYVHSQNPVGRQNIEGLLNRYLQFKKDL
jgi:hypothetical protein